MNKKEISEIRRALSVEDSVIHRIYTCYVNAEGDKLSFESVPLFNLSEEKEEDYLKIFKRVLSSDIDKRFIFLDFDEDSQAQRDLAYQLVKVEDNEGLVQDYFDQIIESYDNEAAYAILLALASYDIPRKAFDGYSLEGSDLVYDFMVTAICPIKLSKSSLAYDQHEKTFTSSSSDWLVSPPDLGFLYPTFTGRQANVNSLAYYTRDPKRPQPQFQENLFGCRQPKCQAEQREDFVSLVDQAFSGQLGLDAAVSINQTANDYINDKREDSQTGPMTSFEIKDMLQLAGAEKTELKADIQVMAENIAEKNYTFEAEGIKITVSSEAIQDLAQRDIDGRSYLTIPIYEMTLNGLPIK